MELKRGQLAVNKTRVIELMTVIYSVEKNIDAIMHEKESYERGKRIASEMNKLTFARHAFQHFELGVQLNKLK